MPGISNDSDLRRALETLSEREQRIAGGRFVKNVLYLCKEPLIERAIEVATDASSSDQEREDAYRNSKAIAVKTYTACGSDADWLAQAEHFVATAAAACLQPAPPSAKGGNYAWKAAMEARMAKNCEMIDSGEAEVTNESQKQYAILEQMLAEKG